MSTEHTTTGAVDTDAVDTYAVVAYLRTGGNIDTHAVELYASSTDDPDNPTPIGAPIDTDTPPPGLEPPRTTLGDWDADHAETMAAKLAAAHGLELDRPATVSGDFAPGALAMIWLATRPESAPDAEGQAIHNDREQALVAWRHAQMQAERDKGTEREAHADAERDIRRRALGSRDAAVTRRAAALLGDFAAWLTETRRERARNLSAPTDAGPHAWRGMITGPSPYDAGRAVEQLADYLDTRPDAVPRDLAAIVRHVRAEAARLAQRHRATY